MIEILFFETVCLYKKLDNPMIQKISPIYFDGHKIIRLSDLPNDQNHLFSDWINNDAFVSLEGMTENDCVQYEDYEFWFVNYYVAEKDLNYLI